MSASADCCGPCCFCCACFSICGHTDCLRWILFVPCRSKKMNEEDEEYQSTVQRMMNEDRAHEAALFTSQPQTQPQMQSYSLEETKGEQSGAPVNIRDKSMIL
ncbi:hypothetical protein BDQ12DRAFT_674204 [Crucibulum laeve]|uniref:Uncharacterized protein n=1 Tax=Crucibulum laeve TaxID=68775 RepID=A0A5C3MJP9_9AGAR|nr:hypothetical protein BDQ12DRAFT_674204 [Crucibulum laeve]